MLTNNVSVQGNERTRCSNSLVKAQINSVVEEECCHKKRGEKCNSGNSEPLTKKTVLSALQDSLLSFVVFDLAPVTGVSFLPIKPV